MTIFLFTCMPPSADLYFTQAICSMHTLHERFGVPYSSFCIVTTDSALVPDFKRKLQQLGANVLLWPGTASCSKGSRVNKIEVIAHVFKATDASAVVSLDPDMVYTGCFDMHRAVNSLVSNTDFDLAITHIDKHSISGHGTKCFDWRHSTASQHDYLSASLLLKDLFGLTSDEFKALLIKEDWWINGGIFMIKKSLLAKPAWAKLIGYASVYQSEELPFWCLMHTDPEFKVLPLEKPLNLVCCGSEDDMQYWLLGASSSAHIAHIVGSYKQKYTRSYDRYFNHICDKLFTASDFRGTAHKARIPLLFFVLGRNYARYAKVSICYAVEHSDCAYTDVYCYAYDDDSYALLEPLLKLGINLVRAYADAFNKLIVIDQFFKENVWADKALFIDVDCFLTRSFSVEHYFKTHSADALYATRPRRGWGLTMGEPTAGNITVKDVRARQKSAISDEALCKMEHYISTQPDLDVAYAKLTSKQGISQWVYGGLISVTRKVWESSTWRKVFPVCQYTFDDELALMLAATVDPAFLREMDGTIIAHKVSIGQSNLSINNPYNGFLHFAGGAETRAKPLVDVAIKSAISTF